MAAVAASAAIQNERSWRPGIVSVIVMMAIAAGGWGCNKKSAPKAPAKSGADVVEEPTDTTDDDLDSDDDTATDDDDDDGTSGTLSIAPNSTAALTITTGTSASIPFTLTGAGSRDIIVGLAKAPTGVQLSKSGSIVTLTWATPVKGSHEISFILRDRAACEAAVSDPDDCDIDSDDYGNVTAQSYDVSSSLYTLQVNAGTGTGSGDLINQIIDLVGGNGDAADLLGVLSSTQLQQVLGLAQLGIDLDSIFQLLGLDN